jgi:galactokinase
MIHKINSVFNSHFSKKPLLVRSPGRVNLIGEHTDYNEGFVLPAAIDKAIYVAISKRNDQQIRLFSVQYNEMYEVLLQDIAPSKHWYTYILGVVNQLVVRKYNINGFDLVIDGDVPLGAGMSSSAAVESAVVFALNEIFDLKIERLEMTQIAQKAEQTYSGVMCGIMDMFASIMGKKDHVIRLDCRDLSYQYFPLLLGEYKIVLFNTQVKHSLAESAYNVRRNQCEEGVRILQEKYPEVVSLRHATPVMLDDAFVKKAGTDIFNRCKYVVEENIRLQTGCELLAQNDIMGFGKKMNETHFGLSKLYEVSCTELDILAEWATCEPAIAGARMMGGGFGGCTINLIKEQDIEQIFERFAPKYFAATGKELKMYITSPQDGTSIMMND